MRAAGWLAGRTRNRCHSFRSMGRAQPHRQPPRGAVVQARHRQQPVAERHGTLLRKHRHRPPGTGPRRAPPAPAVRRAADCAGSPALPSAPRIESAPAPVPQRYSTQQCRLAPETLVTRPYPAARRRHPHLAGTMDNPAAPAIPIAGCAALHIAGACNVLRGILYFTAQQVRQRHYRGRMLHVVQRASRQFGRPRRREAPHRCNWGRRRGRVRPSPAGCLCISTSPRTRPTPSYLQQGIPESQGPAEVPGRPGYSTLHACAGTRAEFRLPRGAPFPQLPEQPLGQLSALTAVVTLRCRRRGRRQCGNQVVA